MNPSATSADDSPPLLPARPTRDKAAKLLRLQNIHDGYERCGARYYRGLSLLDDAERGLVSLELRKKGECLRKQLAKSRGSGAQTAMKEEQRTMAELLAERKFLEREVGGAVADWCKLMWEW